ncbi:cation-translocating P-type ATPase [Nocardia sp. NPDC004568]|uniref:cation-translocating P-type ATPase n=1 Tax=Nocardia sp. NPDC004568 TaxID=3154551 RepID=UPI0033A80E1C
MRGIDFGGFARLAAGAMASTVRIGSATALVAPALVGPAVGPVRDWARVVLGGPPRGGTDEAGVPPAWECGRRMHIDLDRTSLGTEGAAGPAELQRLVAAGPGVISAHIEDILGRLVIELAEAADPTEIRRMIRPAADLPSTGQEPGARFRGLVTDPGDPLAVAVPVVAAVADALAIGTSVIGWLGRFPRAPRAARAAAAVINHQPRIVALLESKLGRAGTDLLTTAFSATAHGLGLAPAAPLLDLVARTAQISEALARRQAWCAREPALAAAARPRGPAPAAIFAAAQAGSELHSASEETAATAPPGPVDEYAEHAANGSLVAAAGTLLGGGTADDIADTLLAGIPKAAHMGRQAYALVLGRGLAKAGSLVLDPGVLRRLDRVRVVVVDGAALRGDTRAVLGVEVSAPGWQRGRIFELADALLHGERIPASADAIGFDSATLRWHGPPDATVPGTDRADLLADGAVVATVTIGWELDPCAVPLIETARRTGARVVLRNVAGTEELGASVTAAYDPGTGLLDLVRELRADRGPVLLISSLHPDADVVDTLAALALADIGVAVDDPAAAAPWTADLVTGADLADAVRVLAAVVAARPAIDTAVRLAKAGSTLAGLLVVTGETGRRSRLGLGRWLAPVDAAGATAWILCGLAAQRVVRSPDPPPQPLTAWHALDPAIVYARILRGRRSSMPNPAPNRRRGISVLSHSVVGERLRVPAALLARLAGAARRELRDPLTPVLAIGAAAAAILGSNVDALLVAGVMSVNALVSGIQRLRAEDAAAALFAEQEQAVRRVVVPTAAAENRLEAARTSDRVTVVSATRLRPGDVLELRAPEVVPADARLLIAEDLEVDESSMTGESVPVLKHVAPVAGHAAERASMLFQGSTIVAGRARAIVVATGPATVANRAISTVSGVAPATGVQGRLRDLTGRVLPLTLAGGAVVTGVSLVRRGPLRRAVADGVAIAVAAVPEGLPLVATMAQLAAARRLSKVGVLVRAPRALEAIGRVDAVCFDKTGTLTLNRLAVVTAVPPDFPPGGDYPAITDPPSAAVVRTAGWACPRPDTGEGHTHATDEAVLTAAARVPGGGPDPIVIAELPFESCRGYAAAIIVDGDAGPGAPARLVLKGAPEVIVPRCRFDTGSADRAAADALVHHLADQGLRVLAVAQCELDSVGEAGFDQERIEKLATDLTLTGYVGLADTVRDSARPLLRELAGAHCAVALITGDHPVTARAIARQLGFPPGARVVTGAELAATDENGRAELAASAQVFARVGPEQKVQVIAALQQCGRVVAMVGDGANDAAAIRMADAGIGVTGRGSSPAREAADLVLTGDNLTALLDALVEGRNMWIGVRDALTLLLGGNAGEVVFTILGTALGRGGAPVSTRQLLLVNLLTDMFPALAIAVSPPSPSATVASAATGTGAPDSVLSAPAPSLGRPLIEAIVRRGAATAAAATAAWAIGRWTPGTRRRSATMGLTALVGAQLAQTLVLRHDDPLVVATAVGSAAVLVTVVEIPGVSQFFGCTPLGPVAWAGVLTAVTGATALVVLSPAWFARRTEELIDRVDRLPSTPPERDHR